MQRGKLLERKAIIAPSSHAWSTLRYNPVMEVTDVAMFALGGRGNLVVRFGALQPNTLKHDGINSGSTTAWKNAPAQRSCAMVNHDLAGQTVKRMMIVPEPADVPSQ